MSTKTLKISELITELQNIKARNGDLPIVLARDSEGSCYSSLDSDFLYEIEGHVVALYPTFSKHRKLQHFENN